MYIKQVFEVFQDHDSSWGYGSRTIPNVYYEQDEEKYVNPQHGDPVGLSEQHTFDRFLLNKALRDVQFQPQNSYNAKRLYPDIQAQLAPLLCHKTMYDNVTREPKVDLEHYKNEYGEPTSDGGIQSILVRYCTTRRAAES